jgi:hypothetical protein
MRVRDRTDHQERIEDEEDEKRNVDNDGLHDRRREAGGANQQRDAHQNEPQSLQRK